MASLLVIINRTVLLFVLWHRNISRLFSGRHRRKNRCFVIFNNWHFSQQYDEWDAPHCHLSTTRTETVTLRYVEVASEGDDFFVVDGFPRFQNTFLEFFLGNRFRSKASYWVRWWKFEIRQKWVCSSSLRACLCIPTLCRFRLMPKYGSGLRYSTSDDDVDWVFRVFSGSKPHFRCLSSGGGSHILYLVTLDGTHSLIVWLAEIQNELPSRFWLWIDADVGQTLKMFTDGASYKRRIRRS